MKIINSVTTKLEDSILTTYFGWELCKFKEYFLAVYQMELKKSLEGKVIKAEFEVLELIEEDK